MSFGRRGFGALILLGCWLAAPPCAAAPRVAVLGAGARAALVAAAGEPGIGVVKETPPDPGACDALLLCAGAYPATLAGKTGGTRWTDTGPDPNTDYYYRIAASNGPGGAARPARRRARTGPPSKALGRPYTKSLAPYPGYPDTDDREATDGVYAGPHADGKSFGYRLERVGDKVAVEITVDLGAPLEIGRASHQNCGAPGYRPDGMAVSLSKDGKAWAQAGAATEDAGGFLVVEFPETRARYVRFRLTKERRGSQDDWLFVGELEVF